MRYKQEAEEQGHSWFWPVIIVIALILIYYLYEKHAGGLHSQTPENATETTLRVEALKPGDVTLDKKYIGYITPINEVAVLPYINGFLEKVTVSGGEEVKAGQHC